MRVGDIGDGTLSWLSPIGWAQKTRPFAGEQWWPFLVIVGATAVARLGRGRCSRRAATSAPGWSRRAPVAPHAAPSLGSPLGLATRLQRGSVIGWSAGMVVLAVAYGSITDSINDFVKDNKALTDIIAAQGHGTLVEQYLAMSFRILALVAAGLRDPVGAAHPQRGDVDARRAGPGDAGLAHRASRRATSRSRSAARSSCWSSSARRSVLPTPP